MKITTLFTLGVSFGMMLLGSLVVLMPEGNWLFLGIAVISSIILGMLTNMAIVEDSLDPDNYEPSEEDTPPKIKWRDISEPQQMELDLRQPRFKGKVMPPIKI
jgi:hypothetical protein